MDGTPAAELYASGLTTSEVGERLGVSASVIGVNIRVVPNAVLIVVCHFIGQLRQLLHHP
jgi:hypothetical protein